MMKISLKLYKLIDVRVKVRLSSTLDLFLIILLINWVKSERTWC